jgi:hypothetical protein
MGRMPSYLVVTGLCLGRFAALLLIAWATVPVRAATPTEAAALAAVPGDFILNPATQRQGAEPRGAGNDRQAYPTEQPHVPVNDALRPPQLIWNPSPASLVKVVPAKVRYKLKF